MQSRVDFAYAFATPHRLTVALPDSSAKTLLDAQPGSLRMAWTFDDLRRFPLGIFATPQVNWELRLQPEVDGQPLAHSTWTRAEGYLPVLDNLYEDARGSLRLQVAGAASAALVRVTVHNAGERTHRFALRCERPGGLTGYNPAWVNADDPSDALLAGWQERADRVVVLGLGADAFPVLGSTTLCLAWTLAPGETRAGWLVRPYAAYADELGPLRTHDWATAFESALQVWRTLLARAASVSIPDARVRDAYYAGLAELFIMREPVAGGRIAGVPGTEVYRAANGFESLLGCIALDQVGLHREAEQVLETVLEVQEPDGNWSDPRGWGHLMWGGSGFKAWATMRHYHLTGDREFLARTYPRMAASARWQEQQRGRMRLLVDDEEPLTYGLMPRGMGDCGLKDGGDLYGVFLPHNIWAVYADGLAVEVAEILGRSSDLPELRSIYATALHDLLRALDRGAIQAADYRWIPGVPAKTSGSRWGALNALTPCGILPPDHELVKGTLRHLDTHLSPGGLPLNTGWLEDGLWVAIALDNLAEAHLACGHGDQAAEYLYATLNHGTPLYTWCEERGPEPGSVRTTGDRQHLWTPVAVVRCLRDMLILDEGDGLHLALGTARGWLASGEEVGISEAPTPFGRVSYALRYDAARTSVTARIQTPWAPRTGVRRQGSPALQPAWLKLHLRLPGLRIRAVRGAPGVTLLADGESILWPMPQGEIVLDAQMGAS